VPSDSRRPLVAQAGVPVTAGDSDVDGAEAGAVLLPAAGGLDEAAELAEVSGAVGELDDDEEQLATAARTISPAATWATRVLARRAARRFPLPERSPLGNTPVPPI
jgi:hypothetical protein